MGQYTNPPEMECMRVPSILLEACDSPLPWEPGLLFGPAGTGKTYRAIQMGCSVGARFVSVPRWIGEMRDLAVNLDDERWFSVKRIRNANYLILDDIGAEKLTEFAFEALYDLIDYRWGEKKQTLVTSNLSPPELASVHGDRLASRILGLGRARKLDGGSDLRVPK